LQLIPPDIKFDPNATPPQFTDNEGQVIEVGSHVRVKLIGTRAEVGGMYAIASIKEDYLGRVFPNGDDASLLTHWLAACKHRDQLTLVDVGGLPESVISIVRRTPLAHWSDCCREWQNRLELRRAKAQSPKCILARAVNEMDWRSGPIFCHVGNSRAAIASA